MSSAGGRPSRQTMVSVGTSIVPPGPRPPPADTPGTSTAATTPQVTASLHDFAVSLGLCGRPPRRRACAPRAWPGQIDAALGQQAATVQGGIPWHPPGQRRPGPADQRIGQQGTNNSVQRTSKSWQVNCGWGIATNIAADLAAWT